MNIKERLQNVVDVNKKLEPKYLANIIKSDFYYLISNYFEVDFDDVKVEINFENSRYIINVKTKAERVMHVKTLP